MKEELERAFECYFKSRGENADQPNAGLSGIVDVDGTCYAVLRNANGILAVFDIPTDPSLEVSELEEEHWPEVLKKEGE